MEQPFLKIGDYTINPNAIAFIHWSNPYISVVMQHPTNNGAFINFEADSPEGKALRKYFDSGMQHVDLVLIFGESE